MKRIALAILLVVLGGAYGLACPELPILPDGPNAVELQLGATNVNAALGSGALTAGFSKCGELTVLKWPGPSYYDQVQYLTSNAPDARRLPHLGALDDQGAFPGLVYRTASGRRALSWLRDDAWVHTQRYSTATSDVLVDEAVNDALGLRITGTHFILPDRNVVNHYEVVRAPRSQVRRATLVFYANFAPTLARLPLFPIADWGLDFQNDFAIVYDRQEHALLHFLPQSAQDYPHDCATVNALLQSPPRTRRRLERAVGQLVRGLTEPGVYIATGARQRDDGFQAGFDDAPVCPQENALLDRILGVFDLPPALANAARSLFACGTVVPDTDGPLAVCRKANGWTYSASNAYLDAQDGKLARSPIAACQANGALARRLLFRRGRATATFDVAIGATREEAYDLLRGARSTDPTAQRAMTETWWAEWLAPAHLPATDDPLVTAFAQRSLVVMRTATDNASGAIVASINTQGPYGEDWVRDGSFINHALDLAGYSDAVSRHERFYARVQRKQPASWSPLFSFPPCDGAHPAYPDCIPAGTYETNYYADPNDTVPGNPISFEIDEVGLGVWTMWDHYQYLTDPAEKAAYLADICPSIELGAVNLAACKDAANNLQCAANEDDNIPLTQGLQGAETVLLALQSAIAAAGPCGFDPNEAAGWRMRGDEIAQTIRDHFVVSGPPAHVEGARPGWLLWPVAFFPPGDVGAMSHAAWLKQVAIDPIVNRTALNGGYDAEALLARAQLFRALGDGASLAETQDHVRFFVRELTTPGTMHLSEFYARVQRDLNGDGVSPDYLPENDVPHVWEHAYLFTAAMVAFGSR